MDTIGERLTYYIDKQEFTKKEFCKENDIVYNNFTLILNNTRNLGLNVLNKIKKGLPNLNVNWLLYGQGDADLSPTGSVVSEPTINYGADPMADVILKALKTSKVKEYLSTLIEESHGKH